MLKTYLPYIIRSIVDTYYMLTFLKNHYHTRYRGIYQHAKKLFIFDLVLLGLATAMMTASVFLFFWKPSLVGLIDISMSLGQDRIKSGELVHLTIDYTNNSKQNLKDVSLGLRLPKGFIIDRTKTPTTVFSEDSIFLTITEVKAGASGQVEIYGQFWTEPKTEARFLANLSYRPENKDAREQKFSAFISTISESVLTGTLEIPKSTFANAPVQFTYTLQNTGPQTINSISLQHTLGTNAISEKDLTRISLPPNGKKVVTGQFTSPNKSGKYSYSVTPQILVNNHPILQSALNQEIEVFSPQVISSARLLSSINFAEPRQMLPVEITWQNKSNFKLDNLTLHLRTNLNGVIDWKKTAIENGAKVEASGIYFDGSSRTNLSNGSPENSDTFTVNIYLLPTFNLNSIEHAKLEIYPLVKAGANQTTGQQFSQEGSRTSIPLATEINFSTIEARYYTPEGDQLGRGPLPPQVGKTTKYWIFVRIFNTSNGLKEAEFKTSLPAGVEFSGKQSTTIGPQLIYNQANRSISWQYYELPPNSHTGLYFEVTVTPNASQVDKNIQLTNTLTFSATDEFVDKKLNLSHGPVFNVLKANDDGAAMGSKVVP